MTKANKPIVNADNELTSKEEIWQIDNQAVAKKLSQLNVLGKVIKEKLIKGADYGVIPNLKSKLPCLFKSGAEKIKIVMGLVDKYEIERNYKPEQNFMDIFVKCKLYSVKGNLIATGLGSCNNLETAKKNMNLGDFQNTGLKMAKKRALVDATLGFANLSGVFATQDIDDWQKNKQAEQIITSQEFLDKWFKLTYCETAEQKQDLLNTKLLDVCQKISKKLGININSFDDIPVKQRKAVLEKFHEFV